MDRPTYVRRAGHVVAERICPVSGSPDAQRLAAAADDPESPWQHEAVAPAAEPGSAPLSARPPQSASKDDWVSWAVACGAGEVAADLMTKAQLIEQYGKGDA